jgi:hypothetical protein
MPDVNLGAAAAALEGELLRFEQTAELIARLKLTSEKNLIRAARAAQEAAEIEERVASAARELVAAVARARERQEAQAKAIGERVKEVQARRADLAGLLARFGALGKEASQINSLLQEGRDLAGAVERLGRVAEAATALRDDAARAEFDEAARLADSLRQQTLSARNKLSLLIGRGPGS